MIDPVVFLVGGIVLVLFFGSDFFIAYKLHLLKEKLPTIEECAPQDPTTAQGGDSTLSNGRLVPADIVHRLVIATSIISPIIALLQMISPVGLSWTFFTVPVWLGYLTIVPSLGMGFFYVLRAAKISQLEEVQKSQWISLMWFRLDVICVVATLFLVGWGDWLLAVCLYFTDIYMAHRLLITERRLVSATQTTQLLREEALPEHENV